MDLEPLRVRYDEEWRILQGLVVLQELLVGGVEVFVLALVLDGEAALVPDVSETSATPALLDALLESVEISLGVDLGWRGLAEHGAEIEEVLHVGGSLRERCPRPLLRESLRCQRSHDNDATSGKASRLRAARRTVGSRGRLRGLPHPRAYKSGTIGILQTALASSIIFYVTRVAVMDPLPGKECYEDKRRDR